MVLGLGYIREALNNGRRSKLRKSKHVKYRHEREAICLGLFRAIERLKKGKLYFN
jgi:hypothetical protein